jgi:hypothetical protein
LGKENDITVTPQKWVNLLSLMLDSFKNNGHHHGQRLYGQHHGNDWPRRVVHQLGRNGASKPYWRQDRLHEIDEEGNIWRCLLAAYLAIPLFRRVVRQCSRLSAVEFPRPRDTQGGEGGVAKEKGQQREAGEDEDGSAVPSPDVGLLRYIPPDQQGEWGGGDLGGESRLHNWSPKLIFRLYSMALNNAYKMYKVLVKQHTPEWRFLDMGNAVRELTHNLCQRGLAMQKLRAKHSSWTRDMSKLFGWIIGRKVRADAKGKGMMTVHLVMPLRSRQWILMRC